MPSNLVEVQKDRLEDLTNFTERIDKEIIDIASSLHWTMNHRDDLLTCTYDSSHRVSKESFDAHLSSCQWKTEGYGKYAVPMSEPGTSSGTGSSIKLDARLLSNVLWNARKQNPEMRTGLGERLIPRTSDRLLTDFTSDERAALYEYVVSCTVKPEVGHDVTDTAGPQSLDKDRKEDPEASFLELLMQERDLKRRRAKHRGVHTNKKSQTEILREVINQQMESYVGCLTEMRDSGQDAVEEEEEEEEYYCESTEDANVHSSRMEREISTPRNTSLQAHERSKKKHSSRSRDRGKREKRSPRRHGRYEQRKRTSRSKERSVAKEDKHRSRYAAHKKHRSRDYESGSHSRHSSDRRRHDR